MVALPAAWVRVLVGPTFRFNPFPSAGDLHGGPFGRRGRPTAVERAGGTAR